jgi:predicted AlkP superfamily phosphohydrolase/phosphomutase
MNAGTHEINRSVVPPITPHAWTTIFSDKNPGMFGYWDISYRTNYAYTEDASVTSMTCKEPRLHNILPQYGVKIGLAGIPVSTPPYTYLMMDSV